jgi:hypothetical protein
MKITKWPITQPTVEYTLVLTEEEYRLLIESMGTYAFEKARNAGFSPETVIDTHNKLRDGR